MSTYKRDATYSAYTQDVDYLIEQQRKRGATEVEIDFQLKHVGTSRSPIYRMKVSFADGSTEEIRS